MRLGSIACLAATLVVTPAGAEGLPAGNLRDAYIATVVSSCFTTQREAPENAQWSGEQIAVYCTCIANALADRTSRDDVEHLRRGGKATPAMIQRNRVIGLTCLEVGFVQGHWRLPPDCEALVRAGQPLAACPSKPPR